MFSEKKWQNFILLIILKDHHKQLLLYWLQRKWIKVFSRPRNKSLILDHLLFVSDYEKIFLLLKQIQGTLDTRLIFLQNIIKEAARYGVKPSWDITVLCRHLLSDLSCECIEFWLWVSRCCINYLCPLGPTFSSCKDQFSVLGCTDILILTSVATTAQTTN